MGGENVSAWVHTVGREQNVTGCLVGDLLNGEGGSLPESLFEDFVGELLVDDGVGGFVGPLLGKLAEPFAVLTDARAPGYCQAEQA